MSMLTFRYNRLREEREGREGGKEDAISEGGKARWGGGRGEGNGDGEFFVRLFNHRLCLFLPTALKD